MKIYVVTGKRDTSVEGRFMVGIFSSNEEANLAMEEAKGKMGSQFSFFMEPRVLNQRIKYHDAEDISLEERVEALEQYMNVAQQKIVALEARLGAYHNYTNGPSREELKRQWQILVDSQTGRNK